VGTVFVIRLTSTDSESLIGDFFNPVKGIMMSSRTGVRTVVDGDHQGGGCRELGAEFHCLTGGGARRESRQSYNTSLRTFVCQA
jgi:hypothetical protein